MSKYGPIKTPPEPNKKRKLGSLDIKPGKHAGRDGLMGQPKNSQGYSPNMPQKPSGPGGSD